MQGWFNTMDECKEELLKTMPDGRYEVLNDFVVKGDFEWDWVLAGCKSETTGEEFHIVPEYPNGKPEELEGLEFDLNEVNGEQV